MGGDLLTQIPLQFNCREKIVIKLNISHVPLDIKETAELVKEYQ